MCSIIFLHENTLFSRIGSRPAVIEGSECEDKLDGIYLLSDQGSIANSSKTRVFKNKINHSRSNISSQKHHFFQQKGLKKLHLHLMLAGLMSSIIVKKLFFSQEIADSRIQC